MLFLFIQDKMDQSHLLLISLKAGGRGLSLTSEDTVILMIRAGAYGGKPSQR
jgi:SNF2 family DNA or RNA helicase